MLFSDKTVNFEDVISMVMKLYSRSLNILCLFSDHGCADVSGLLSPPVGRCRHCADLTADPTGRVIETDVNSI